MVVWVKLDKPDNLDKSNGSILNFPKSQVLFKVQRKFLYYYNKLLILVSTYTTWLVVSFVR